MKVRCGSLKHAFLQSYEFASKALVHLAMAKTGFLIPALGGSHNL